MPARGTDPLRGAPQVLQDRVPSVGVRLVALCPRMDLVALALDGDTIAIQRLSWQRLATVPPLSPPRGAISALVWAPSGGALAVGSASGHLRVVRVNPAGGAAKARGEERGSGVELGCAVTALQWVEAARVPPPGYAVRDVGGADGGGGFVVVGDAGGGVTLFSYDLAFRVARVGVFCEGVAVRQVFLAPDLACVFAAGVGEAAVELRRVGLGAVLRSHDELVRAGAEAVAMREILAGLEGYVKTVGEAWVWDAMGGLAEAIVAPLEKLAFDYAEDTNVGAWHVLYNAFCGGGSSGALEQFLAKELSESGAKEALRSFTALSKDAREALTAALPLAERAVFRASEYRGLARCRQRFTDIGVSVAAVDRTFSAADGMLDLLGLISEEMEEADAQIYAFLRWITSEAAQVDGSDPVEHAVVGDDEALEEHALVTAFFKSMLEDGREAGKGAESVSVLYERLTENVMPELVAASKTMLALPSQTMERVLSDIADGDVASCELNNCYDAANSGSLSMTVREVSNGIRVFEAALLTNDQQVFLAQCPLSGPAAGADQVLRWCCALAKVEASGASVALRAVAHLSTDSMAFVEALPKCSDEMEALALFTCSTLGVEFDSCIDESQVSQVIDGTGRISTKFCTASKSPGCSLTVERERCLASTLIGSRRVVLFDLRPTGLDAEPKSEPANADLTQ